MNLVTPLISVDMGVVIMFLNRALSGAMFVTAEERLLSVRCLTEP